jgi:TP901 family phage tail tape measure protein
MANITSQLIVQLLDQVSGPAKQVGNALRGITRTVQEVARAPLDLTTRLDAAITRNNRALANARMGLADAVAGFYALRTAIAAPVEEAMRFESAMADVKKVVDFPTPKAFDDFKAALMDLSRQVPMTVNGLAEIAAAAGQAGIAGPDLIRFTEAAAKIGVAFDISAQEAGEAMSKMMTGLGLTIDKVVLLSDAINHLSNAQASSAAEVMDVVRRVGAQAKMFGYTAEQVAAFGSAMIAAGADSDVAATSFRNMGLALTKGASATKAQHNAFAKLGLDQFSVAERMQQDAVATTVDVLERLSKLPKEVQASVASDLFGNEARALGPLLTNLDLVYASLGLVGEQSKYAGSAFREFENRNKTFGSALQRFNNIITILKISIGNALLPALNSVMQLIAPLIDAVSRLATAFPNVTAAVVGAAAAFVALRVAITGLTFLGLMGKGGMLATMAVGVRTLTAALAGLKAVAITGPLALMSAGLVKLRASLVGLTLLGATGGAGSVFKTLGASILGLLNPMNLVRAAAVALRGALLLSGVGAILLGIAAAGKFIYDNWSGIKEMFSAFGTAFTAALGPVKPMLDPVISAVGSLFGWLGKLSFEISPDRWRVWGEAAGTAVGNVVRWFAELPAKIAAQVGSLYEIGRQFMTSFFDGLVSIGNDILNWASGIGDKISSMLTFSGPTPTPAVSPRGGSTVVPAPARARGGPVSRGSTYMVGEKGPELITAGRSGYVNKAGAAAQAGPITVAPVFNMTFNGKTEPEDVVQQIRRVLRDEVRETFRGVFSDTGMRMA